MTLRSKIRYLYYQIFGGMIFDSIAKRRLKGHEKFKSDQSRVLISYRKLEKSLQNIKYPDNEFNKIMGMILSDIELFEHVVSRFRSERKILAHISHEDQFMHFLGPRRKSYPSHPLHSLNDRAIKIDVQSLFVFGMVLINRSLLLMKMYLPDKHSDPNKDMYAKLGNFYYALNERGRLSEIGRKYSDAFLGNIKWLYSTLRFYRNEFIEHLDRSFQQGLNFGTYTSDFALASYKWNYDDTDNQKVEDFRTKLEKRGVKVAGRSSGGRSLINRFYIQRLFENIVEVPNDLLKEAQDLIEDIGVHSPQPEKVISEIENYMTGMFDFITEHLNESELARYKV